MPLVKDASYREIPYSSETPDEDFHVFLTLREVRDKITKHQNHLYRCRTIGVVYSEGSNYILHELDDRTVELRLSLVYATETPYAAAPFTAQLFGFVHWRAGVGPCMFALRLTLDDRTVELRLSLVYATETPYAAAPFTAQLFGFVHWRAGVGPCMFALRLTASATASLRAPTEVAGSSQGSQTSHMPSQEATQIPSQGVSQMPSQRAPPQVTGQGHYAARVQAPSQVPLQRPSLAVPLRRQIHRRSLETIQEPPHAPTPGPSHAQPQGPSYVQPESPSDAQPQGLPLVQPQWLSHTQPQMPCRVPYLRPARAAFRGPTQRPIQRPNVMPTQTYQRPSQMLVPGPSFMEYPVSDVRGDTPTQGPHATSSMPSDAARQMPFQGPSSSTPGPSVSSNFVPSPIGPTRPSPMGTARPDPTDNLGPTHLALSLVFPGSARMITPGSYVTFQLPYPRASMMAPPAPPQLASPAIPHMRARAQVLSPMAFQGPPEGNFLGPQEGYFRGSPEGNFLGPREGYFRGSPPERYFQGPAEGQLQGHHQVSMHGPVGARPRNARGRLSSIWDE